MRTMMMGAALLLGACGGPVGDSDASVTATDAGTDAGVVMPMCDDAGVAHCPPFWSPACGAHAHWALATMLPHNCVRVADGLVTCEPFEPLCPEGSEPTCIEPATIDGMLCQGNPEGE